MISITNNLDTIFESIPWRNGIVPFTIGKTIIKETPMDCFILNDLKWLFKLNPSFMFCVPATDPNEESPFGIIRKSGASTNGIIVIAKEAQRIGYSKQDTGKCKAKTYFFGRPQDGRTFDLYFRLFERGFSISNITNISIFDGSEHFDISCSKKDYSKSGVITGNRIVTPILGEDGKIKFKDKNMIYIPARIVRR